MDLLRSLHSVLADLTSLVDWEALGAIATFAAVIVALWPIYQGRKRDAAHARGLRIRIANHVTTLQPTLEDWKRAKPIVIGTLSPGQFKQLVSELMEFMNESSVLAPEEQDHLSVVLTNLSKLSVLYEGGTSNDVLALCAENQRTTINELLKLFGRHGYLSGSVNVPWAGTGLAKGSSPKLDAKGENATPEWTVPPEGPR